MLGDGVDTNDRPFHVVPVRGRAPPGLRARPPQQRGWAVARSVRVEGGGPPSTRSRAATDMKILVTAILAAGLLLAALLGGVVSESRSAGPAAVDPAQAAALRSGFGSATPPRSCAGCRTRPAPAPAMPRRTRCSGSRTRSAPARPGTRPTTPRRRRAPPRRELDAQERLRTDRARRARARAGTASPTRSASGARRRQRPRHARRLRRARRCAARARPLRRRRSRRSTAWSR